MKDRVSITMLEGGIADVRLIRSDKMNALDPAMFAGIAEAIAVLEKTAGLRVVILSGEGRAFCAGLDMASMLGEGQAMTLVRAVTATPICRNMLPGGGERCPSRSSRRRMESRLAEASSSSQGQTSASPIPKRAVQSWSSNGDLSPTWRAFPYGEQWCAMMYCVN